MHTAQSLLKFLDSGNGYVRLRGAARLNEESREALLNDLIWFASVASQDDIYEGSPVFKWVSDSVEYDLVAELVRRQKPCAGPHRIARDARQIVSGLSNENARVAAQREIEENLRQLYRNSSILSLFQRSPNQRDWAQYAEGGRGFGFVFDFRIPWPLGFMDGRPSLGAVPLPVEYVKPDLRPAQLLRFGPSDPADTFEDLKGALLTKSDVWADQQEQRLFRVGLPAEYVGFPSESLVAIILGYDCVDENQELIRGYCSSRSVPIPLFRAQRTMTYELELVRVWP